MYCIPVPIPNTGVEGIEFVLYVVSINAQRSFPVITKDLMFHSASFSGE
jgi:hypothetical protein